MATLNPEDYVARKQDGVWDEALREQLKQLSEEDRAAFLVEVLVRQELARYGKGKWFALVRALVSGADKYELLLTRGLEVADASTVKEWLECCVQRMGIRWTIGVLGRATVTMPGKVELTKYWLPALARSESERAAVRRFLESL